LLFVRAVRTKGTALATRTIDAVGLRCPQPILQLTIAMPEMQPGDILEIKANCESFEDDVRTWCARLDKTLLAVNTDGAEVVTATIQF
jgi:tRNA 2-thiouridine synthesizing protein A